MYSIDNRALRSIATLRPRFSPVAYLCNETGGQVLSTNGPKWGDALGQIVNTSHLRYLLAYMPPQFDLGWHNLKIKLAAGANRKYRHTLLKYRSGYLGAGNPPRFSLTDVPRGPDLSVDSSLSEAVAGASRSSEIPFDVEGATYEGPSTTADLTLKMGDDSALSWTPLSHGSHRSEITIVIDFLSTQSETIGWKIKAYEIVHRPNDSWTLLNQRIIIDSVLEYPVQADRIRLVIRDETTGRIGTQDVPMKRVLDAPKLRAVIY